MYWVLIQCGSLSRIYLDLFSWWMLHVILEFNSPNGLFSPDLMKLCNIIYVPVTVAACITANYPHRMIRRTISPPSKYLKTNIGKYLVSGVRQCRVYMSRRFEGCRWWIEDAIAISYRDAVDQLLRFFSLNIVLRKVWQTGTFREIEDIKLFSYLCSKHFCMIEIILVIFSKIQVERMNDELQVWCAVEKLGIPENLTTYKLHWSLEDKKLTNSTVLAQIDRDGLYRNIFHSLSEQEIISWTLYRPPAEKKSWIY